MKLVPRIGALLALALMATTVAAPPAQADTTYRKGQYSATKISHPDQPLRSADGIIDFNGAPDRAQSYSWSAVGYGDDIYIGTCYAAVYTTIRIIGQQSGLDQGVIDAALNVMYNGDLFVDPADPFTQRGVLVKLNTKTGAVTIIDTPGNPTNYRAAIEYEGKLYFASSRPALVEVDPATDAAREVYSVPKPTVPGVSPGIRGLAVVNGELVSAMISDTGASIVASSNPSDGQGAWRTIATQEQLFDYPAYKYTDSIFGGSVWDIIEFDGSVYVSIVTGRNGDRNPFALVRGDQNPDGSYTWKAVVGAKEHGATYPFGLGAPRSGAANLVVFDNHLYIGGYNDPMIALPEALVRMQFENLYADLANPVNLWKMDADDKISMVAGEANALFPEGPTGNMGSGFGSNANQYVWRMTEYQGQLYVGTFDVSSLAYPLGQIANGDILKRTPEEWARQIQYLREFIALLKPAEAPTAEAATEVATQMVAMAPALADEVEVVDAATAAERAQSASDFRADLAALEEAYDAVKAQLPADLRAQFEAFLNPDSIANLEAFIGMMKYLSKAERGFDLLVSKDGDNFSVITRDGFGDPFNHGLRVFATTDQGLGIGTANPFYGTQVWLLKDGKAVKAPKADNPNKGPGNNSGKGQTKPDNPNKGPGNNSGKAQRLP